MRNPSNTVLLQTVFVRFFFAGFMVERRCLTLERRRSFPHCIAEARFRRLEAVKSRFAYIPEFEKSERKGVRLDHSWTLRGGTTSAKGIFSFSL